MYSGGFFPFPEEEIRWAWWARHIYFNRYVDAPRSVYSDLRKLVDGRDYFVITTSARCMIMEYETFKGKAAKNSAGIVQHMVENMQ